MLEIYTKNSNKKGPHFLFLGSVHGNETCGSLAIDTILEKITKKEIEITEGKVTFIPRVNRKAFEENKRFIDVNLNRVIKDNTNPLLYEEKIAQELITEIKKVDYVVDLHSMTSKTVPMVFIDYPTQKNKKLAVSSDISHCVYGWQSLYSEKDRSADTIYYANLHKITGITIECGQNDDIESFNVAYKSIIKILSEYGCIQNKKIIQSKKKITKYLMKKIYLKNNEKDFLERNFKNFDFIQQGKTIAIRSDGKKLIAPTDGYIMLPNISTKIGHEWFYFGTEIK